MWKIYIKLWIKRTHDWISQFPEEKLNKKEVCFRFKSDFSELHCITFCFTPAEAVTDLDNALLFCGWAALSLLLLWIMLTDKAGCILLHLTTGILPHQLQRPLTENLHLTPLGLWNTTAHRVNSAKHLKPSGDEQALDLCDAARKAHTESFLTHASVKP